MMEMKLGKVEILESYQFSFSNFVKHYEKNPQTYGTGIGTGHCFRRLPALILRQ
jgi:hypothetical protein